MESNVQGTTTKAQNDTTTAPITEEQKLQNEVNAILKDSNSTAETVETPFGVRRDGVVKTRSYPKNRKKRKKVKSGLAKTTKPKQAPTAVQNKNVEATTEQGVDNGSGGSYESYMKEYLSSLDPDAKTADPVESIVGEGGDVNTVAESLSAPPKPPRKYGNSLVIITQFVLPIFCAIATRLISRNKKRPGNEVFALTDFDKAMLKEIADDGAGEEILGQINPAWLYLLVVVALGSQKVMDNWDKDKFNDSLNEVEALKKSLEELKQKYESAIEKTENTEVAPAA